MPNTKKRYISDIIDDEEIAKWLPNQRVLIRAGTGSGKSYFVAHNLFEFAKQRKRRILWLSNRNLLKSQIIEQLDTSREEYIDVMNYQKLQEKIRRSSFDLEEVFKDYIYIVFDEVHYIFSDAGFNSKTEIILNIIRKKDFGKIFLMLTATPHQLLFSKIEFNHNYEQLKEEYDYIKDIYFYSSKEEFTSLIKRIPLEDKIIYFSNNAELALEVSRENDNSSFICSEENSRYKKYIKRNTIKEIVQTEMFSSHILATTRVLDNGINIKDENVKHIIIDFTDIVQIIQSIGRVRILDSEHKVTLYIKNRHNWEIRGYIDRLDKILEIARERFETSNSEFLEKYEYENFDNIVNNTGNVNLAVYYSTLYKKEMYEKMLNIGFKKYICSQFYMDERFSKKVKEYFGKMDMESILIEFSNRKLFDDDKKLFQEIFMESAFSPKRTIDKRNKGINTINGILDDLEINYIVKSVKESKSENRSKMYWIIERTNKDETD